MNLKQIEKEIKHLEKCFAEWSYSAQLYTAQTQEDTEWAQYYTANAQKYKAWTKASKTKAKRIKTQLEALKKKLKEKLNQE